MSPEVAPPGASRSPLGDYLRTKRLQAAPEEVGIRRVRGRRSQGLRRKEVAELADISVAYYGFLERGRDVRPSRAVLDALGRALRLSADERAHLHALAGPGPSRTVPESEGLSGELEELLEALDPNPAYAVGGRWDVLGANHAARRLFCDWNVKSRRERNLLHFYCCDPAARSLFVDWQQEAADQLALFRDAHASHPDDASFDELLGVVFAANPQARRWWEQHTVDPKRGRSKRIRLADGSIVQLRQLVLQLVDDPEVRVITYFADRDGDADDVEFDT